VSCSLSHEFAVSEVICSVLDSNATAHLSCVAPVLQCVAVCCSALQCNAHVVLCVYQMLQMI